MFMRKIFSVVLLLLVLSFVFSPARALAQTNSSSMAGPLPLGHGRIFVFRAGKSGHEIRPTVRLNGQAIQRISPDTYFWIDVPAGEHEISAATRTKLVANLSVAPGSRHFVRIKLDSRRSTLRFQAVAVEQVSAAPQLSRLGYEGFISTEALGEDFVVFGDDHLETPLIRALASQGRAIISGGQDMPQETTQNVGIVFIIGKWPAVADEIDSLDWLADKVVVDLTVPWTMGRDGYPQKSIDTSVAEEVQERNPEALVIKALVPDEAIRNSSSLTDKVWSFLVASDSQVAKDRLARSLEQIGLKPVDFGPLLYSRQIEALQALRLVPGAQEWGERWEWDVQPGWRSRCADVETAYNSEIDGENLVEFARAFGEPQVTCFELLEE